MKRNAPLARLLFNAWGTALRCLAKWVRNRFSSKPARPAAHLAGEWGEEQAARLLRSKGYRILGRRVRLSPREELDLVAACDGVLVFVEVKTRRNEEFGRPYTAVNRAKKKQLSRAALRYLQKLARKPAFIRFDVIEVVGEIGETPNVRHIENAFTLERPHIIPW